MDYDLIEFSKKFQDKFKANEPCPVLSEIYSFIKDEINEQYFGYVLNPIVAIAIAHATGVLVEARGEKYYFRTDHILSNESKARLFSKIGVAKTAAEYMFEQK
jgi:hypothetical protein